MFVHDIRFARVQTEKETEMRRRSLLSNEERLLKYTNRPTKRARMVVGMCE